MRWTYVATLLLSASVTTAAPSGTSGEALRSEITSLVRDLDAVSARGTERNEGPVRFEGIAWESPEGTIGGTSLLGAYLASEIAGAESRTHRIVSGPESVGERGLVGSLLGGSFARLKDGIRVTLRLFDEASGLKVSEVSRVLGFDLFPASALDGIEPPDAGNLRALAGLVEQYVGKNKSAFGLRVSTDRGKHAAYQEGESLAVYVEAEKDCHVRLYHVSWRDRTLTLIHPNRFSRDDEVRGGTVHRIPADTGEFMFEVSKPYGVDAILAVASETPFADDAEIASGWDGSSSGRAGRATPSLTGEQAVQYESGYVVETRIDESRLKGVLDRGLVIRPSTAGRQAPSSADGGEGVARAVCYFTTVPDLLRVLH